MKNQILLQEEFVKWLVDNEVLKSNSASSYCDYINAADRSLDIYENANVEKTSLLTLLVGEYNNGDFERVEEILDDAADELSTDKIEKKLKRSLKYIQNWKSALYKYKEFLHDTLEAEVTIDDVHDDSEKNTILKEPQTIIANNRTKIAKSQNKGIVGNPKVKYNHTSKDLYDRFHFRIITQDRHYDEIYYPISFIKRFFYYKGEKKFIDNWVKELLQNVTIHINGGSVKLNQISEMVIENMQVHVDYNGAMKMALTKISDNIKLVPFSVSKLRFVSIDHEDSLQAIMRDNIDNLKTFQQITSELKRNIKQKGTAKKYKIATNIVLNSDFINEINIENLKAEMKLISDKTKLQLMDSKENTSKGQK